MNDYRPVVLDIWPERSAEVERVLATYFHVGGLLRAWKIFPEWIELLFLFPDMSVDIIGPPIGGHNHREILGPCEVGVYIYKDDKPSIISAIRCLDRLSYVRPSSLPDPQSE